MLRMRKIFRIFNFYALETEFKNFSKHVILTIFLNKPLRWSHVKINDCKNQYQNVLIFSPGKF